MASKVRWLTYYWTYLEKEQKDLFEMANAGFELELAGVSRGSIFVVSYIFKKKNFMASFYGWRSIYQMKPKVSKNSLLMTDICFVWFKAVTLLQKTSITI